MDTDPQVIDRELKRATMLCGDCEDKERAPTRTDADEGDGYARLVPASSSAGTGGGRQTQTILGWWASEAEKCAKSQKLAGEGGGGTANFRRKNTEREEDEGM